MVITSVGIRVHGLTVDGGLVAVATWEALVGSAAAAATSSGFFIASFALRKDPEHFHPQAQSVETSAGIT